ncbi:hypothetical protein PAXRUDRAFT_176922 [Paxillus rubicundulus Ve08.2h10]|uniref:Unplaced genomic scaffold scaffold_4425, whole genome shotgun sequence n=1 Tax=Paxillus rubicundulus Ve08.2h10 TaxID=930991 RepID=A0A0D0CEY3_9AGAM|nr:hypothetical protein PAXRUDRAFT_176922 [Paxillus rubicundulus Ve08.2h10]
MSKPHIIMCADGHYHRAVYGIEPYIADYPEQALLACIVQGWCPKCTANRKDLDGSTDASPCTHEHTRLLMEHFQSHILWQEYEIIDDILPFTADFPRENIHELIAPDIHHQIIKGTFTWVKTYLKLVHGDAEAKKTMADIDHCIAAVPSFLGLRHFPQGRRFKQWTGDDSKALMKAPTYYSNLLQVFLPAIAGYVPSKMVQAISAFMEFCYIVHQPTLDEADLDALDTALETFERKQTIFEETGVHPACISIPWIHSLQHYHHMIQLFCAPDGLFT